MVIKMSNKYEGRELEFMKDRNRLRATLEYAAEFEEKWEQMRKLFKKGKYYNDKKKE